MSQRDRKILHDYKTLPEGGQPRRRRRHGWPWFAAGLAVPLGLVLMVSNGPDAALSKVEPDIALSVEPGEDAVRPLSDTAASAALAPEDAFEPPAAAQSEPAEGTRVVMTVGRGDTLERLFRRNDLRIADMFAILRDETARRHLTVLRPGDRIVVHHEDGHVRHVERELDEIRVLNVAYEGEDTGFVTRIDEREVEVRVATAHARITSSLFNAGRAAGIADSITMRLAGLFQWDIDFALEIREGDEFRVIYEELWRDGERLRHGSILAAEFVNRGRQYRAVRFEMEDGADYFTPEGRSVRKAFIRAPVDFTRISSNFNPNRRHPVLNTIRAHRGVDYAAPTGTPIQAAGDGRVIFRGEQGGYGNTVIIQHGGNITTLYAHMSRFHPQVRNGTRVRQGQTIGYVGMTGMATGPHLHYEYRVNGVHRNPRTVELPPADPVPAAYRDRFAASIAPLLSQLENIEDGHDRRLAMAGDSD